jgi:hypothetical protein
MSRRKAELKQARQLARELTSRAGVTVPAHASDRELAKAASIVGVVGHRSAATHDLLSWYRHKTESRDYLAAPEPAFEASFTGLNLSKFSALLHSMGFSGYADYLVSPPWFDIRGRKLKSTKGRCEFCGALANQVHHEMYTVENMKGESLEGLYSACYPCHQLRHKKHA